MSSHALDAVKVGSAECDAWAAYYRREWRRVLVSAVRMVRAGFGMSWPRTMLGALLVARANRAWAPYPDNDPAAAQELMQRFYGLVLRYAQVQFDPARAAELEVRWWAVHRAHQRENSATEQDLVDALTALYAYTHAAADEVVRPAAEHRTIAMRHSDAWHRRGCHRDDPLLEQERTELIDCYRVLGAVTAG